MDYWAKPGLDRRQTLLFCPTLDECISDNHPVRLLDEILMARDWSAWTQRYDGRHGQPPIPPWTMAGVILYGLMRRIRSSRQLEYACTHNVDFMWLAERRSIDHDTICKFRAKFKEPLKDLFKQVNRVAMTMGLIQLVEVAFDGTRVKANASRMHTWTAAKVEKVLAELEAEAAGGRCDVTATSRCARRCTPSSKRRKGRIPITGGCTSARRRLQSSRESWRCGGFSCEAWRRCRQSGAGCVPPAI